MNDTAGVTGADGAEQQRVHRGAGHRADGGQRGTGTAVTPETLTFTGAWRRLSSATESAATGKVTLAHTVAGADYGSVTAEPVVVSVVGVAGQQPTIQVGVSSSAQTLTVPEGGANSYALVLGSRPTGDVTIGVTFPRART